MKTERHEGNHLKYLTLLPDDYQEDVTYPLVIMLHGFGANMDDLAGLAPAIETEGYVYACPNAPIPFDLGLGQVGYGWSPPRGQATSQDIQNAESLLKGFFEEIFEIFEGSDGNAILLGFSQGGGMTYRCGIERPDTFKGLVALSANRDQPIFIAHGLSDAMVSMETARNTKQFLESEGYNPDYHEYAMGHEIPLVVMQDMIPWMLDILPPCRKAIS